RPYQQEAIDAWVDAGCRGVLSMATGTGKTLTALAACLKVLENQDRMAVVVVAPYTHLVEQWAEELKRWHVHDVIRAYGSRESWIKPLSQAMASYNLGVRKTLFIVTTNATFATETWQEMIEKIIDPVVLIADEMHHMGAPQQLRS